MGFWDRDVSSSLDEMFDLNGDGKLDLAEESLEFEFLEREEAAERLGVDVDDLDDLDLEDISELEDLEDLRELDLDLAGLDEDEVRDALEYAGLDADDFDF